MSVTIDAGLRRDDVMLKTITASFLLALQNIRSNFFHTILSLLGIVIGVAALVSILSLIDGMEKFAQDQISQTTSLRAIIVGSQTSRWTNGIQVKRDDTRSLFLRDFEELSKALKHPATGALILRRGREVQLLNDTMRVGSNVTAVSNLDTSFVVKKGRLLNEKDFSGGLKNTIITEDMAKGLSKEQPASLLNKKLVSGKDTLSIVGIVTSKRAPGASIFYPIILVPEEELRSSPPGAIFEAKDVTHVQQIKKEIEQWLNNKFGNADYFHVSTNEFRVEQAAKGFKLFRIIMGLIVGISVLVGGIGVMNVLLISVTERTSEIGVRKAVGANKRDIVLQFLSESITISLFGSLIGLVLGILGTMAFVPIIKAITKVPFQAEYTLNTLMVISIIAVLVGIVFGTYPAMRAANLDPVEAIRRE